MPYHAMGHAAIPVMSSLEDHHGLVERTAEISCPVQDMFLTLLEIVMEVEFTTFWSSEDGHPFGGHAIHVTMMISGSVDGTTMYRPFDQ